MSNQSEIRFGKRLLETLTAALYSEPLVVFREYVQNAVDSFIRNRNKMQNDFCVEIDIIGDKITIRDNGFAIPSDSFLETMLNISASKKGESEIGFRGIGRLSGMSFCKTLTFRNKYADSQIEQSFIWKNYAYRELLKTKEESDIPNVLKIITEVPQAKAVANNSHYFEVEMVGLEKSLVDCIFLEIVKEKKVYKKKPTDGFIAKLADLLPVPYKTEFTQANRIRDEYYKQFGERLASYEFPIKLNGSQIFKTYTDADIGESGIQCIPFLMKDAKGVDSTVGFVWLTFNFKFKAYRGKYGISVRNKNVLLAGETALADEASRSMMASTSHGQFVSAIKCVKGEFYFKTNLLSDNSKRDWFRIDDYSLQLREMIHQFMTNMHIYRYKASAFFGAPKSEVKNQKDELLKAYEEFVTGADIAKITTASQAYASTPLPTIDLIADAQDIPEYSVSKQQFYVQILKILHGYYDEKGTLEEYYAVKAYILKKLGVPNE